MASCPNCGADNPERAKFCLECGSALGATPTGAGSRKLVTVLFADIVGSTALGDQLDPEALRAVLARYFDAARRILERHGGTVEKFIGDAVMAVFGIPQMHEDDALRAARAADELRREIGELNDRLGHERGIRVEFRIGVNTGEVVVGAAGGSGSLVTGDAVNVAARLEQGAPPGEVLIGASTLELVRGSVVAEPVTAIAAKGKSEPVAAYRLVSVSAPAEVTGRAGSGLFVGRVRELRRLQEAFEDAQSERRCYLFTLLGSAGVGKSRLIAEFTQAVGETTTVVAGRCLPYGEGITFWPIAEIVRALAGTDEGGRADAARERVAETVGNEPDGARIVELVECAMGMTVEASQREDVFWAIRRWLEAQARRRPLVCVIEDIHWAESTLLDLLEHIADWTRDAPILLLCTARPELLESRPNWGGGKVNATTILLEPLPSDATRDLVGALVTGAGLPTGLVDRILETAEGNPLFAEEIVRMLADERQGRGTAVGEALPMPTSVQAVIAARLDRLPAAERRVAERASVAGRVFERGAVVALLPDAEPTSVGEQLLSLMRKELVQPDRPELTAGDAFRFRHVLIRDAAYEALAKQERSELHERFAGWIEDVSGERAGEYAEIIGYHYEQAQRYRRELGLGGVLTDRLAEHAAQLLAGAARRAHLRGDLPATTKLYRRAAALLPPSEERCAALFGLALALQDQELAEGVGPIQDLEREAVALGLEPWIWKARLIAIANDEWSNPQHDAAAAEQVTATALTELTRLGDGQGVALALYQQGEAFLARAQWARATEVYERGLDAARRSDAMLEDRLHGRIANAAMWGATPVDDLIEIFERRARDSSTVALIPGFIAGGAFAYALKGDADEARSRLARALARAAELVGEADAQLFTAGYVGYVLGDLEAAERDFRKSIAVRERLGETGGRSTLVGMLALVVFERGGSLDEVARLAEECRALSGSDDAASQALWRAALGLVSAARGDTEEAERLLSEARAVAGATDFLHLQGTVERAAASAAEMGADRAAAIERMRAALDYYERKGDMPDAERARTAIARLEGAGRA